MPAPRKALKSKKTPLATASHVLEALHDLMAMDDALKKEGEPPLLDPLTDEAKCLASAELVLCAVRIRARKQQKDTFEQRAKESWKGGD
jgi:hypothetical protein